MKRDASHNLAGSLWMIASMAGFAVEDAFLKSAASHVPVGQVMLIMGIAGTIAFAALAVWQGQSPVPADLFRRTMIIRSVFEVAGRLFYALAVALTPISTASAILQATPLVVVLGAAYLFGEKVGVWRWALIGAGFAGVMIIIRPGAEGFDALSWLAVLGLLGFAGRDLATRAAAPSLSMARLGVAGFVVLAASGGLLILSSGGLAWPSGLAWAQIAATTLFGLFGYGALTQAMRTGQVSAVTPFRYSRLLFAMGLGITVFGERPDPATILGSLIIVGCGVVLLSQSRRA